MLHSSLAPYLLWAKTRQPAAIDLAGSNLLHCTLDDLPGARDAVDLSAKNDDGYAPLLERIASHHCVSPDRVVTATGCSGANFMVIAALVGAGDEVIVERPYYDPLVGACELMGARVTHVERRFKEGFAIDLDDLRAKVTARTKLIIVTTPHNPSGVSLDAAAMTALGAEAERVGAHVLVDEVYLDAANLVDAAPSPRVSAARLGGPFIATSSLTKSYGLAGLRCGWAIGPASIMARLRRTRDVIDNAGSAPADRLAAHAFSHLPELAARTRRILGGNIANARNWAARHPALQLVEPPAASVMFPRLQNVDVAAPFVRFLLEHHGVAVADGHYFGAPAHIRISLAGDPDTLSRGLTELSAALSEFPGGHETS